MDAAQSGGASIQDVAEALRASKEQMWLGSYRSVADIASYRDIPLAVLHASHELNVERAVDTLRSGRLPAPEVLGEAQNTTIARIQAGVPIEDVIRAYRLSIGAVFKAFIQIAQDAGLADSDLLDGTALLWGLSDLFVAQAVQAHRRYSVETVISHTRLRNDHVRAVLNGTVSRSELEQWVPDAPGSFRALLARVDDQSSDPEEARLELERVLTGAGIRNVVGVVDAAVAGYVMDAVPQPVDGLSIAVGHLVGLADLPASYRIARSLLGAAHDGGGVATVETSGWRLAVDVVEPLAAHLRSRYLDPLRELGEFGGDLLTTLAAYLAADRHVNRCAAQLNLHPNSLRYRLARVSEVLDVDLNETETVITLAMALELARRP